jgi:uncharacterized protein (TIGR03067 family)
MTRESATMSKARNFGLVLASILAIATSTAARADDAAIEKELKKLDGEWTVTSGGGGEVHYKFKGKKLEVEAPSRSYTMTITIDPAAKPDKTIDFKIDEAPDDAKGKTSKGIYKFEDDDTFTFCMRPEGDRPTKFEQIGFEQILSKLKRKKK